MKYSTKPTINELSDIYSLLKGGVTGFMLTGETTAGKNNREIVNTLNKTIRYYEEIIGKGKVRK